MGIAGADAQVFAAARIIDPRRQIDIVLELVGRIERDGDGLGHNGFTVDDHWNLAHRIERQEGV